MRAREEDRRSLFLTTSRRLGTAVQNVEKDFWVSWTLDALFNGLPADAPRLLFKGGTSLSKAYSLIDRFSEDVDVTVHRADLGQGVSAEELQVLSGKKRQTRLDAIKTSAQTYINGPLLENLGRVIEHVMKSTGQSATRMPEGGGPRLVRDESDPDRQTLLFWYPIVTASATPAASGYTRSAIKIESGAKSALDPHGSAIITPYIADDVPRLNLSVQNVITVDPGRTFWDKLIILHGQRSWFERRGVLRGGGQRISRHYYDVFRLSASEIGEHALSNHALALDCARHARMFFNRPDLDLAHAIPGTLAIAPTEPMMDALRRDYTAMSGMIFGPIPAFDDGSHGHRRA
ncbi:MAG TPA: nucleotidyl transferase AbiEii/AbiGii toxin family protein [Gemmatimonadaceae bacterium]